MPQADDDKRLGELLVTTGKLSNEELLACFEAQRQLGGAQHKRLGEILVERGHLSEGDLQATLTARESLPAMPAAGDGAEPLPDEVREALADPSRCIGRYAVLSELGRGGMGVVHRCYDPELHRSVAIKMILESEADPESHARFQREARAVAKLQHHGIVALHEVGEHEGRPYLVMDFVEGQTFSALLENEKPNARRVVEIVRKVALALHHAHEAGIIHRDVKPQNIMVDPQGKPHVMDFGLARISSARQQLTQTGQIMGTPAFMAPEQADADIGAHGPWTDVYALGAMLYRALSGQTVFKAHLPAAMLKMVLMDEPKPLHRHDSTISVDLETITHKCLEKEPRQRYPSAAAVAEELQRFLEGLEIVARPIGRSERVVRWMRRNRGLSAALVVVVAAVVGATVVVLDQAARTRRESEQRQTTARKDRLAAIRKDVSGVLDRVRSGEVLKNPTDAAIAKAELLRHRDAETVRLVSDELNGLSKLLAETHELSLGNELLLGFLCEALWNLGMPENSLEALGNYLETEIALPSGKRNQLRAVSAAKALCLLGGKEARRLVRQANQAYGLNSSFERQVADFYKHLQVEPILESETAEGYTDRGQERRDTGDLDGAIADHTRAIEIDPKNPSAWLERGRAQHDKGDFDRAIADYTRAIEIDPNLAAVWTERGRARQLKGELDGAIADHSRALEIEPNYVGAWYHRGSAWFLKDHFDSAIKDFTSAIDIDPNHAKAWNNRGTARLNKGELDGAIADFTQAINIAPNDAMYWHNRGGARYHKGDFDGSIADYARAIDIEPGDADAWHSRGVAKNQLGDLNGAVADYTRAIEIDPNHARAWNNRGLAREGKGDLDGAIADFTQAINIAPNDAMYWHNRGGARYHKGDFDGSIADYARAIDIEPGDADNWYSRGVAKNQLGDLNGVVADYSSAIDIDPNFAAAWLNRGAARRDKGELDSAITDLQRFLELAPNNPNAALVRAAIQEMRAQQAKAGAGK